MKSFTTTFALMLFLTSSVVSSQQPEASKNRPPRLTTDDLNKSPNPSNAPDLNLLDPDHRDTDSKENQQGRGVQDLRQNNDPKLRELASLPVGLVVTHYPNPIQARVVSDDRWPYVWSYLTMVRALSGPIRIKEFGAFAWKEGAWEFSSMTGKPYSARHFREWYSCPDGVVRPDSHCSDSRNWSRRSSPEDSQTLWYFIGVDEKGKRVKGEAIIELSAFHQ
jgi:hypothetical protein